MKPPKIVVRELQITSPACPSAWRGKTDDGKNIYIRYRHGKLWVDLDGHTVFQEIIGGMFDGLLWAKELKEKLQDVVDFQIEVPDWAEDDIYPQNVLLEK